MRSSQAQHFRSHGNKRAGLIASRINIFTSLVDVVIMNAETQISTQKVRVFPITSDATSICPDILINGYKNCVEWRAKIHIANPSSGMSYNDDIRKGAHKLSLGRKISHKTAIFLPFLSHYELKVHKRLQVLSQLRCKHISVIHEFWFIFVPDVVGFGYINFVSLSSINAVISRSRRSSLSALIQTFKGIAYR